jgi:sporulation integral membrane protein YlbJ
MTERKIIYRKLNKSSAVILGYIPISFIMFFIAFLLMRFPSVAAQGITDGIDLSLGTLIPTLFPFMVLSSLMIEQHIFDNIPKPLKNLSEALFSLDGLCLGVIILSLIGGLPLGCKMTAQLYENGKISRWSARRMMLFCFCMGPAFTIGSVGLFMLSSQKAGVLIYASLVLSALSVGVLSKFFENEDSIYLPAKTYETKPPFSVSLVRSVSDGGKAILNVCAWVIIFSCIINLAEVLPINESVQFFLDCTLEVTNAAYLASGNLPLPIIAGIIGFGGLCGHCQVMPYIIKLKLNYKYFLVSRIISGALAVIYCKVLLKIFPVSYEVFSVGTLPTEKAFGISSWVSIGMLFTAALFLLGDSTAIKIKSK